MWEVFVSTEPTKTMNEGAGEMRAKAWAIIGLALVFALFAVLMTGCEIENGDDTVVPGNDTDDEDTNDTDADGFDFEIINEWLESGHSNIQVFPAGEEGCVGCHDGGGFAEEIDDPADLDREFPVAIDCRACHTGTAIDVLDAGTVDIPTMDGVQAGVGSLCMSCHNGRRTPDPAGDRVGPHYSSEADIVTASGAMEIDGVEYLNSESHETVTDTCFGCHGDSHAFAVAFESCEAAECHTSPIDVDTPAEADYDGDGSTASFQEEVEGLLQMLEEAIADEIDGGSFVFEGGMIVFTDGADAETDVDDDVYSAAYNHVLVTHDGSMGLHNPAYVVSVLQESYTLVTGEEHPGEEFVQE